MSVTGIEEVKQRLQSFIENVNSVKTEAAVTEMLILGAANAHMMTPIDTSALINSQSRATEQTPKGWNGYVYYGAFYAGYVHAASGKLKGKPRAGVESFTAFRGTQKERVAFVSDQGNFWDPDAEPQFLTKGMEDMAKEAPRLLKKHYEI